MMSKIKSAGVLPRQKKREKQKQIESKDKVLLGEEQKDGKNDGYKNQQKFVSKNTQAKKKSRRKGVK